jgi:hypothetical protein
LRLILTAPCPLISPAILLQVERMSELYTQL